MAAEDIRMLRSATLLRRFTVRELMSHAKVKSNTAGSWLKRNRDWLREVEQSERDIQRGRPAKLWTPTPEGVEAFKRQLAEHGVPDRSVPVAPDLDMHLHRVRNLVTRFGQARTNRDVAMERATLTAARLRIRVAWETYAEAQALGYSVPFDSLRELAGFEYSLGVGEFWTTSDLPEIGLWVADRVATLRSNGIAVDFAGRIIRARAEVRGPLEASRLTAAAVAMQVWADEGLAADDRGAHAMVADCMSVMREVHLPTQFEHVAHVLKPVAGFATTLSPETRQAVVLGVANFYRFKRRGYQSPEVSDWLLALRHKTIWTEEMAPAVAFGTLDAPSVNATTTIPSIGESLEKVLEAGTLTHGTRPGAIRTIAYNHARLVLAEYRQRHTTYQERTSKPSDRLIQCVNYFSLRSNRDE